MSLRNNTLSGLAWTSLDVIMIRGLAFGTSIFLARLLQPEEFGLIGMISVFIAIGITFIDSGLSESLIRAKKVDNKDFSSVFFMNVGLSIFIYLLLFFIAPIIGDFYNQQILIKLIRVYALCFIFSAFSSIQICILVKNMQFRRLTLLNLPGAIIGSIVGVLMGYYGYGVWSIIIMYLTTQILQTIFLWGFSLWKPNFYFSFSKIKDHLNFGYKLLLAGLLNSFFNNIYNVLIGKFFPIKSLGFYERSFSFSQQPVSILSNIINKVTYPMLSKIQDDSTKMSSIYKEIFQLTYFISTPAMIGLASVSEQLFSVVLGEKWMNAVPYFQILCLASVFYPINAFNLNILKVFGRTDLFLKLEILKKIVILITVAIGFSFGIYGLLWSTVISAFGSLIINGYYSSILINYSTKQQLLDMLPVTLISFVMFIMVKIILIKIQIESNFYAIIIGLLFGWVFYIFVAYLFRLEAIKFLKNKFT